MNRNEESPAVLSIPRNELTFATTDHSFDHYFTNDICLILSTFECLHWQALKTKNLVQLENQ